MPVDPYHTGLQTLRQGIGSLGVGRPNRPTQAKRRIVGARQGILTFTKLEDRQHGPKLLLINQPTALLYVSDDGGSDEIATLGVCPVAAGHNGAVDPCIGEELFDLF